MRSDVNGKYILVRWHFYRRFFVVFIAWYQSCPCCIWALTSSGI